MDHQRPHSDKLQRVRGCTQASVLRCGCLLSREHSPSTIILAIEGVQHGRSFVVSPNLFSDIYCSSSSFPLREGNVAAVAKAI